MGFMFYVFIIYMYFLFHICLLIVITVTKSGIYLLFRYLFMCEDWLSAGEGDGSVERILHLSSKSDISKNGSLLKNNIYKTLFDDHLWLSLGFRKARNQFTRLQRLCTCLAMLFLTMISDAMFFGTGDESNKIVFQIATVSLTIQQLYSSIVSSFVILPPLVLITTLFERSGRSLYEELSTRQNVVGDKAQQQAKKQCMKHYIWLSLAYSLVAISVTAGAFFTILYTFEWGQNKSKQWLGAFMLSFVESIMFIQPLKVRVFINLRLVYLKKKMTKSYIFFFVLVYVSDNG